MHFKKVFNASLPNCVFALLPQVSLKTLTHCYRDKIAQGKALFSHCFYLYFVCTTIHVIIIRFIFFANDDILTYTQQFIKLISACYLGLNQIRA